MSFLLNDVVFELTDDSFALPPPDANSRRLSMGDVTFLGAELFAEVPSLQRHNPKRCLRLIGLILSKSSTINAALFIAPSRGCPPHLVTVRYAELDIEIMADLMMKQTKSRLTLSYVNSHVWSRAPS